MSRYVFGAVACKAEYTLCSVLVLVCYWFGLGSNPGPFGTCPSLLSCLIFIVFIKH